MKRFALNIFILFTLFACAQDDEAPQAYKPIDLDLKTQEIVNASNNFGFELLNKLQEEEPENLMISPLSVSQALGMTWNGAGGTTRDEMTTVLGFSVDNESELNKSNKTIRKEFLLADNLIDLNIANSIWYRNDFNINDDFVSVNREYYDAKVEALDFGKAEESKSTINNWVDDQTRGKIPEIVDDIKPTHVMFLINAVYFKGKWTYQFDKNDTKGEPFYLSDGSVQQTQMMKMESDLSYFNSETCTGVALPYGNGHYEMVVMVPVANTTLTELINSLDDDTWNSYMDAMVEEKIQMWLPKFTFECEMKLNNPLVEMGMPLAFSDGADFSKMGTPSNLMISKVKHKTFVEVNEEGTEAAAVTSVEIGITSVGPGGPLVFKADRPFLFAIREKDTGAVLFLGQMYAPAE